MDIHAADRDLAGQLDQHALCRVAIHRAAGDGDVGGRGDVLAAALHHDAGAAIAIGNVVAQGEVVGAGDHVEAVAIVVVGDVVFKHAVAQVIGHEAVQTVAMRHAVLDHHVDGLLVRVETVARAILDLDAVEGDVRILAVRAWDVTVEPAVHLAGGGVAVTVQRQVLHAEVVGFFAIGRAHDAGHLGVRAVREFDDRLAHAGTRQGDVALEHQAAIRRLLATGHDVRPGSHHHFPAACRSGCVDRGLNGRRIVGHAVAHCSEVFCVEYHGVTPGDDECG